jgi:hypothetical protein
MFVAWLGRPLPSQTLSCTGGTKEVPLNRREHPQQGAYPNGKNLPCPSLLPSSRTLFMLHWDRPQCPAGDWSEGDRFTQKLLSQFQTTGTQNNPGAKLHDVLVEQS